MMKVVEPGGTHSDARQQHPASNLQANGGRRHPRQIARRGSDNEHAAAA